MQNGTDADRDELSKWFETKDGGQEKITAVKEIFERTKATEDTRNLIEEYTDKGLACLENLEIATNYKEELKEFALSLMQRTV